MLFVVGSLCWLFVAGFRNMSRMYSVFYFLLFTTYFDFDLFTWVLATLTLVSCHRRDISSIKIEPRICGSPGSQLTVFTSSSYPSSN